MRARVCFDNGSVSEQKKAREKQTNKKTHKNQAGPQSNLDGRMIRAS